jgi:hypothetical protein
MGGDGRFRGGEIGGNCFDLENKSLVLLDMKNPLDKNHD